MAIKIKLDNSNRIPLDRQIIYQIKSAVASGLLQPGEKLWTVRHLAADLSVDPRTVARAYAELEEAGFIDTQMGSGVFVGHTVTCRWPIRLWPDFTPVARWPRPLTETEGEKGWRSTYNSTPRAAFPSTVRSSTR